MRWRMLAVLVLVASVTATGPAPAQQREVVFLGFGGTHEKSMKERLLPAFERAHGVQVVYVTGTMASNFARVQAQKSRPEADVLWNNDLIHVTGKRMGLYEGTAASCRVASSSASRWRSSSGRPCSCSMSR